MSVSNEQTKNISIELGFNAQKALESIDAQQAKAKRPVLQGLQWINGKIENSNSMISKAISYAAKFFYFATLAPIALDAIVGLIGRAVDYSREKSATQELKDARNHVLPNYIKGQYSDQVKALKESANFHAANNPNAIENANAHVERLRKYEKALESFTKRVLEATKAQSTFAEKIAKAQEMVKTIAVGVEEIQKESLIQDLVPAVAKALAVDLAKELAAETASKKDINPSKIAQSAKALAAFTGNNDVKGVAEQIIGGMRQALTDEQKQTISEHLLSKDTQERVATEKDQVLKNSEALQDNQLVNEIKKLGTMQAQLQEAESKYDSLRKEIAELEQEKQKVSDEEQVKIHIQQQADKYRAKDQQSKKIENLKKQVADQKKAINKKFAELSQIKQDRRNIGYVVEKELQHKAALINDKESNFFRIEEAIDELISKAVNKEEKKEVAELSEENLESLEIDFLIELINSNGNVETIITLVNQFDEKYDIIKELAKETGDWKQIKRKAEDKARQASEDAIRLRGEDLSQEAISKIQEEERKAALSNLVKEKAHSEELSEVVASIRKENRMLQELEKGFSVPNDLFDLQEIS